MEINFKEWLELTEKFKGLKRLFNQSHPEMPNYVKNDLYNTRISGTMNNLLKSTDRSDSAPGSASKIFQASGFSNSTWNKKPQILDWKGLGGVTPASFTPKTQSYFIHRLFGFKEEKRIRQDSLRMTTQNNLMNAKEDGENEPIIVKITMNGYDLLEGWHRTMNYLLKGAPLEQIKQLKSGDSSINFSTWKPVKILAYIGAGEEAQHALAGTGRL